MTTATEIAALFFRPTAKFIEDSFVPTNASMPIKSLKTSYPISAKQFSWLLNVARNERTATVRIINNSRGHVIDGAFMIDGKEWGFEAMEMGNGAAIFKLVHILPSPKFDVANFFMAIFIAADEALYAEGNN